MAILMALLVAGVVEADARESWGLGASDSGDGAIGEVESLETAGVADDLPPKA